VDTEALVTGAGGATLGALLTGVALRGQLRAALGLEPLEARLSALEGQLDALREGLVALRAECSGEEDSPRARQRASTAALADVAGRLARVEAELHGALSEALGHLRTLVRGHQ
jgi:hypothetical protein